MKLPEADEQPVAWTAILADTPVYSSEGEQVGTVREVLGAEDIFHGIVVRAATPVSRDVQIPADHVARITNRRVDMTLTMEEISALDAYNEEASFKLGIVGLLRKHLGWVPDEGEGEQR